MGFLSTIQGGIAKLLELVETVNNRNLVSEVYSPRRVILESKKSRFRNLAPGLAMVLTVKDPDDGQPCDFSLLSKRIKARDLLRQSMPALLIGSPVCTASSTSQRLNRAKAKRPEEMQEAYVQACVHMGFVASFITTNSQRVDISCTNTRDLYPELGCIENLQRIRCVSVVRVRCVAAASARPWRDTRASSARPFSVASQLSSEPMGGLRPAALAYGWPTTMTELSSIFMFQHTAIRDVSRTI